MSYVHELNLSVRTYNAVTRFGIETVEELEQRIDEFTDHAPNCGKEARAMLDIWRMNNPAGAEITNTEVINHMDNSNIVTVDDKYDKAFNLNARICFHAQQVEKNLFEVCKGLKEMHDSKLYKELGYSSFEQYTEEEVGIKRHQAQKYIAIADMKNGDSSHHFEQLGVTKLALLAKLDEPQREEIQQAVRVEDVSVRELKDKITALTKQKEKLIDKVKRVEDEAKTRSSEFETAIDTMRAELHQKQDLTKELTEKNTKLSDDLDEAMDNIIDLEKQINELKNRPRETFEDTTKIEKLTKQLLDAEGRLAEMEKNKSASALRTADTEEVFKAYMASVFSSIRQLGKFIGLHKDDPARSEVNKWLGDARKMLGDMIS